MNYLHKLLFFGHAYSILFLIKSEDVHRYTKPAVVYISSMERIMKMYKRNVKPSFSKEKNLNHKHTCAREIILKKITSEKQGLGYMLDCGTILVKSSVNVCLSSIWLPIYNMDEGRWTASDDDNSVGMRNTVIEYEPICIKIY